MWGQQSHGDENYFESRTPDFCDYVGTHVSRARIEEVEEALALRSADGGWLW